MRLFPFDIQNCSIEIGSFLHTDNIITLATIPGVFSPINMEFFVPNKEFYVDPNKITAEVASRPLSFYPSANNVIPMIRFTLTLERKPIYYMIYIILPTVVFAALSTVIFLIPVDAGEKLGVGITILLSYSVFMLILADKTPQNSENLPVLGNCSHFLSAYDHIR